MTLFSRTGIVPVDATHSPAAAWQPLTHSRVTITGGLWAERQAINRAVSLRHGYRMLEQSGNFHDLRLAAGQAQGEFRGPLFMDSDMYKWLEAVGWELGSGPDAELQGMADEAIRLIAAAQTPEGYLNSYYQVVEPERRWANLEMGHELYCAGHLIQAAVAFARAVEDTRLLDVARRFADYIDATFRQAGRPGAPGHPEIEMALVELYRLTGTERYLQLARYFVDQRGHGLFGHGWPFNPTYFQDRVPVRETQVVEGHAVRQLYLTSGVTDLYLETGEQALWEVLARQWADMTTRKLYLTGGVGARYEGEAFGDVYELPNDRAYTETCAAIASILWNWRLLLARRSAAYADLIERTLYNGFLSGVSLDGTGYFYINPLLSRGGITRPQWHGCACCPPNAMRLLASLGHYLATRSANGLQVHQYAPARIETALEQGGRVTLRMETDYPWDGAVQITVEEADGSPWTLALRVPGWCEGASLRVDGEAALSPQSEEGYLIVERAWQRGDVVRLDLPMAPRLTEAHPYVDATRGSVAIEYGPLVYCLEDADQAAGVSALDVEIDPRAPLRAVRRDDLLGGIVAVEAAGYATDTGPLAERLYAPYGTTAGLARRAVQLVAVPYALWANRGGGAMRVWIPAAQRR